jgi:single-stranded-DNA-specific exonuclease
VYKKKSSLNSYWTVEDCDERLSLSYSQIFNISPLLAKLILIRNIKDEFVLDFLNPNINNNIPNPFLLKDMDKAVNRIVKAIENNEKIGIIADYDVDGSTSAAILFKFLIRFKNQIFIEIPNRLTEGYGPNFRVMDQMLKKEVSLVFTLDCGTSSFGIIDNKKYSDIDVIVIDHHLSEINLPKVFSLINPNRHDEESQFNQMAAVGVTFLFLMALRKRLRDKNFFSKNQNEPNLLSFLDLVALGTICDVVKLVNYNRTFVKLGLSLIKKRQNLGISKIIDNSNINTTPTSSDLGFIVGPQLNAASRIDDSSLASQILISNDILNVEVISKKLMLLNEKRKLIENIVFDEAVKQAENQKNQNFILVFGKNWHNGVLGIVASKLINKFNKPSIVISFTNSMGVGSARSIENIDLGDIILNAKNKGILISGGGHKMAAGLQINFENIYKFSQYLSDILNIVPVHIFKKIDYYDLIISSNEVNAELLDSIEQLEPFGSGNPEPKFIIKDFSIENIKILKEKHLLIFSQNEFSVNIKAICFNCINTVLGDYLLNFKNNKLVIGCAIRRDNFSKSEIPQLVIKDAMIIN